MSTRALAHKLVSNAEWLEAWTAFLAIGSPVVAPVRAVHDCCGVAEHQS